MITNSDYRKMSSNEFTDAVYGASGNTRNDPFAFIKKFVPIQDFNLNFVESGTCVKARQATDIYSNNLGYYIYDINIGKEDVINYAEKNSVTLREATLKLAAHEVLHISLGHFGKKYKDHDKKLLNIAGDLHINHMIDLKSPGIRAIDFKLPEFLTTDEYYKFLSAMAVNSPKMFENLMEKSGAGDVPDTIGEEVYDDRAIGSGKLREDFSSKIDKAINYHFDLDNQVTKGILKHILKREQSTEFVKSSKVNSYQKLNNRRQSDFILPGKIVTHSGTKKKFSGSPLCFIDMSGSTCCNFYNMGAYMPGPRDKVKIREVLTSIASFLHSEVGATIIYYTEDLCDIVKPDEVFRECAKSGGTNINRVMRNYETLCQRDNGFSSSNRIYVFTDGEDYFEEIAKRYDMQAWFINKGEIKKIEMNKN